MMEELGRLVRVSPRVYWPGGAADFSRWLARDDNIRLLDDVLGLKLNVEVQHHDNVQTGILCRDAATRQLVLIESQLERTDQAHLGRLLTRVAGFQAVVSIWIAERFTEEHRATLDWLNDATNGRFSFIGIELELLQIGNSPLAPRLTIVSKPDGWSKTVSSDFSRMHQDDPTIMTEPYQDYWAALKIVLMQRNSAVQLGTPTQQPWCSFSSGSPGLNLVAAVDLRERRIMAGVLLNGSDVKRLFEPLHTDKQAIEAAVGVMLDWCELPAEQQCHIQCFKNTDPADRRLWGMQHTWLAYALEALRNVLGPRIEHLYLRSTILKSNDEGADPWSIGA